MNVWRLPVDAGGKPGADPEPVTTGTQSMGWTAPSRDGKRMVAIVASNAERYLSTELFAEV